MGKRNSDDQINSIPDLHYRKCRSCKAIVLLTPEISRLVKETRQMRYWESSCSKCSEKIEYQVLRDNHETTYKDDILAIGLIQRMKEWCLDVVDSLTGKR
jgi:dimeric dUTPase (all-alpha-NTP-PPase superfamily)